MKTPPVLSTLADLIPEMVRLGRREALRYDNGFRTFLFSYQELLDRIRGFQSHLSTLDLNPGSRVILWSENRPEWVFAFWACVLEGIQVVPLDFQTSPEMVERISGQVGARMILHGEDTRPTSLPDTQRLTRIECDRVRAPVPRGALQPDHTVQILFTSGTTGRPSGVVHRHRNICSNLEPFRREIYRYRRIARPFQPLRILDLLPLSHMFGQAMGLFIPVLLGGSVVLTRRHSPRAVLNSIRRHRVSVVCLVPRMLRSLREEVVRSYGKPADDDLKGWRSVLTRWWRHRAFHRDVGLKFWAFVVGGAAVEQELEEFWRALGLAVVQGYGLTESSPVVAVNHPFHSRPGALGEAVPGQEIKLARDGEILVRGPSVASQRIGPEGQIEELLDGGWLHTGDIGRIDEQGRLYFLGRKKDVIVLSSGLNVHPEDVEAALNRLDGVRESVVVAARSNGEEVVHAALILEGKSVSPRELVERANRKLLEHQRILSWFIWPEDDFPRTSATGKVRRHQVAARIQPTSTPPTRRPDEPLGQLLPERVYEKGSVRLDEDLGLTSLERVELLGRMEDRFGVNLSERAISESRTIQDLQTLIREADRGAGGMQADRGPGRIPRWGGSFPARYLRRLFLNLVMAPLFRSRMDLKARGIENLRDLAAPVIFAANHASHLDTAALLTALPASWRKRIAPAARKEYFDAYWSRSSPLTKRLSAGGKLLLACLLFNAFPLPERLGRVTAALRYAGELTERRLCVLIYPEGRRTPDGEVQTFKSGVGLLARELDLPVIPVGITGTFESMSVWDSWPRRGPVRVVFGEPMRLGENETAAGLAGRIEDRIKRLTSGGAPVHHLV